MSQCESPSPDRLTARFPLKRATVAVFLLVAAIVGYQSWRALYISHAVAMHTLACELVRSYVIKHDGQWPKSWSDLEDGTGSHSGDSMMRRIKIDFRADTRDLASQSANDFDAIRFVDPQFARYRDDRAIERLLGVLRDDEVQKP